MLTWFAFLSIFLDRRQDNGLFGQQRLSVTLGVELTELLW